jgi:regulatory protein
LKILSEKELQEKITEKIKESAKGGDFENTAFLKDTVGINTNANANFNITENEISELESDLTKQIKKVLLTLLARREYSQQELREKLNIKGFPQALSEKILQTFIENDYQSDQRYCEMLIRSRIIKFSGPFKIRMELKKKGVSEVLVEQALSEAECDWFALALEAAQKKTANWKAFDFNEKGKLMRFLQGRGFDQEHISYAVEKISIT